MGTQNILFCGEIRKKNIKSLVKNMDLSRAKAVWLTALISELTLAMLNELCHAHFSFSASQFS